jgi:hypothetical protein
VEAEEQILFPKVKGNTKKPSRNYSKKKRTINPLAILSQNFAITP